MTAPPSILACEWGRIEVEGLGVFKDVKLWPGGGREWDWAETGTHHRPGIQFADVEEVVAHGASVIVLGLGVEGALGVAPGLVAHLEALGIAVEIAPTPLAIERYRAIATRGRVGGLFHSTC